MSCLMSRIVVLFFAVLIVAATCKPLEKDVERQEVRNPVHRLQRRFINTALTFGGFADSGVTKMRTRREVDDTDDCEKLRLCKLHARSGRNFFAAYELYFVNKENARLWDHRARSMAECQERFGDSCYDR